MSEDTGPSLPPLKMFSGEDARMQVKKEDEHCSIDMSACAGLPAKNFMPQYPDFSDSRRWGAPQCAPVPATDQDVNKHGGAHSAVLAGSMSLKFSGRGSLEAYLAQFELLAAAAGWSDKLKAVQLALSLTEDAAECLLLLSSKEREDYAMLVETLQRRFGVFNLKDSLRCEFKNRVRQPGEPLRTLAHDIESLGRRAYATMPSLIQGELVRDQFVHALTPNELRLHVQLAHPVTLGQALEYALESESAICAMRRDTAAPVVAAPAATVSDHKPAWVEELIHAVKTLSAGSGGVEKTRTNATPPTCWGCGQPGHTLRRCPEAKGQQGNGRGSV